MTVAVTRNTDVDTELAACEAVIERGLKTFVEVGEALLTIRNKGLYFQDHDTFEDYCQAKWGFTGGRARRLIDAANTVKAIQETVPMGTVGTIVPTSERQARELTGLTPEKAAEVMTKAHEDTGGKVTAAAITEAREQVAPKPPTVTPIGKVAPAPPDTGLPSRRREPSPVLEGDALAKYDAEKMCENFGFALGSLEGLMVPEHRYRILDAWKTGELGATPHNRALHNSATIRRLAAALNTYADEMGMCGYV